MSTLHLIEPWWPGAREADCGPSDAAVICCAASRGADDQVCIVGPRQSRERAASLGLAASATILPLMGRAAPRASALRRVISGLGGFDTVRAWTRGAVALGLGAGTGLHDSSTLEGGDGLAAVWSRGPALHSRTRARELMGLSQHELAVGLIADPPSEGDAIEFLYFKMLVEKAGFPSLSTVAGGARQLDRARGFHRATSPHSGFLAWHGAMLPVMAAFDAVVLGPTTVRADSLRDVRARIGAITAAQAGVAMVCAAGDCVRGMPGVTESKDVTRSSLATALMSALEGSHAHRVSNGR